MGIWLENGVRVDLTAAAGDFYLTQYRPRIFESTAATAIGVTDTSLFSFSGAPGQIQAASLNFTKKRSRGDSNFRRTRSISFQH